jgi:hypothetical protein
MQWFLFGTGLIVWLDCFDKFIGATTALQQIVAACIGVSGSVLIGSGAIVEAVRQLKSKAKPETSTATATE